MKIGSKNSNIGLRHLEAAVSIREQGAFVRAAEKLNVAPSALTETIRQLEDFVEFQIFERGVRPVRPTEEALEFLDEAEEILARFRNALIELRRIGGLQRGHVRIGAAPSVVHHLLADALRAFRQEVPGVDVSIFDDVAERVADLVRRREVDFGIVARGVSDPELDERCLLHDVFGLVCHRDHPLARSAGPVRLAEIPADQIISLQTQTGISQMLRDCPAVPAELQDGPIRTFSTISQMTLVSQNVGIALLPRLAAAVVQSRDTVFLPIEDLDLARSISVLTRRRMALSPAAAAFLTYVTEALAVREGAG